MSQGQFSVLIAGLALLFTALSAALGLLVRIAIKWTRNEEKIATVAESITELVRDKDKTHQDIVNQMREDRNATNERLTWLERNLWRKLGPEGNR